MNAGRVIFHGTVHEAQTLFTSIGLICPLLYNPAEFYVNRISDPKVADDIVRQVGVKKIVDNSEVSENYFSNGYNEDEAIRNQAKVSWISQVFLLSHRGTLNFLHSPKHYLIELLILLVSFDWKTFSFVFYLFF